jgi:hypothetical protein
MGEFEYFPKGVMCTLMPDLGDSKHMWDKDDKIACEAAEEHFDKMLKKHCTAFTVGKKGKADKMIKKFNPNLERIIFVPPMGGG